MRSTYEQSKGTPAADKKTDPEKAKAFLLKCYTTASISLKVLDESSSYNFTGLSAEDTRKLLTKSIQLNMKQLKATDVHIGIQTCDADCKVFNETTRNFW